MAGSGGCIRLHALACSSPTEATQACRSFSSWSKPVAFLEAGEEEEEGLLMRRGCGPDGGRCAQ